MPEARIAVDINNPGVRELVDRAQTKVDVAKSYGRKLTVEQAVDDIVRVWTAVRNGTPRVPNSTAAIREAIDKAMGNEELVQVEEYVFYVSAEDELTKGLVKHVLNEVVHFELAKKESPLGTTAKRVLSRIRSILKISSPKETKIMTRQSVTSKMAIAARQRIESDYPNIQWYCLEAITNMLHDENPELA